MKVRTIIQARMGSTRLRGKTLSPILGIPLLKRVIDVVTSLKLSDDIFVVTTNSAEDDPVEAYCNFINISCLRGDTENVFSRFLYASLDLEGDDTLIRITADNIFYQKDICKQLLELHNQNNNDYTGVKGLSHIVCELLRVRALRQMSRSELTKYDKEHVTPYLINNPDIYSTLLIVPTKFGLRKELDSLLTIDTESDRDRIENLIREFENKNNAYSQINLYNWLLQNN